MLCQPARCTMYRYFQTCYTLCVPKKGVKMMAKELKRIDISNVPELLRIVEEVRKTEEPQVLRRDSEDLAILTPMKRPRRRAVRGKPFTKDDSLWNLVGIGHSGLGDVSENKHKYLGDAYLHQSKNT